MPKATLNNLDSGQLEMMWSMLKIGGLKASKRDVQALIDSTDYIRQALIQKTGGQRSNDPNGYVDFDDMQTHINILVCACLSLRASGVLEKMTEIIAHPKTNADRIRRMTDDEELLSAIGTGCYRCAYSNGECDSGYGEGCIAGNLEWLRKEVSKDAAD